MVQIYRRKWTRGIIRSFLEYLRDLFVFLLPIKRLPASLIKVLYGTEPRFAFLVHARFYEDIFISMPFLKPMKFIFRKGTVYRILLQLPPFVLNKVETKQGVNGFVVALFAVPEVMFSQRKAVLAALKKSLQLISKISCPGTVAGLGGWLPMISARGTHLEECAKSLGLQLTNGHCGTLASIYMTVERISVITGIRLDEMVIAVIGVGKMGLNVARAFNGKVARLVLIDVNQSQLDKAREFLKNECTAIEVVLSDQKNPRLIRSAMSRSHLGICATSTFRNLLKLRDIPDGFVVIDDTRPEAIPRDPKNERIVLEGGLLKVQDALTDYDYGFGKSENVFGCLGEAFLLALDQRGNLDPTIGDVDMENFFKFLNFCRENGVQEGDLKSSDAFITEEDVRHAFEKRGFLVTHVREK